MKINNTKSFKVKRNSSQASVLMISQNGRSFLNALVKSSHQHLSVGSVGLKPPNQGGGLLWDELTTLNCYTKENFQSVEWEVKGKDPSGAITLESYTLIVEYPFFSEQQLAIALVDYGEANTIHVLVSQLDFPELQSTHEEIATAVKYHHPWTTGDVPFNGGSANHFI